MSLRPLDCRIEEVARTGHSRDLGEEVSTLGAVVAENDEDRGCVLADFLEVVDEPPNAKSIFSIMPALVPFSCRGAPADRRQHDQVQHEPHASGSWVPAGMMPARPAASGAPPAPHPTPCRTRRRGDCASHAADGRDRAVPGGRRRRRRASRRHGWRR